jgi:O-antigen/teichoic acid export membrane protein
LFPAVVNAKKQGEEQYNARLQKLYDLMVWIALPITLVVTFSAGSIVRLLYGAEFARAASVLRVYIWAGIFVFWGVASSKWFLAENLQLYSFLYKGSGAVINVILNLVLIKRFGVVGAAWATIISYGCAAYFLNFTHAKTRSNFYRMSQSFNIFRIAGSFRRCIND